MREKKVLQRYSGKCHFICLAQLTFWIKVRPFNFLPENHYGLCHFVQDMAKLPFFLSFFLLNFIIIKKSVFDYTK